MSSTAGASSSVGSTSAKKRKKNHRSNGSNTTINKNKQSGPLVPPPHRLLPSRKRARKMTTEFHKLLKEQEQQKQHHKKATSSRSSGTHTDNVDPCSTAERNNTGLQRVQEKIEKSRQDYQRASQVSTLFHSTSKWVLGVLAQNGWLYGRKISQDDETKGKNEDITTSESKNDAKKLKKKKKEKQKRRPTRLLEIGAINTELLDAATVFDDHTTAATTANRHNTTTSDSDEDDYSIHDDVHGGGSTAAAALLKNPPSSTRGGGDGRLLQVRALDLHSMDPRIEEADFLTLPTNDDDNDNVPDESCCYYYDVIVCSMVLNCGMTPQQRGDFIRKMCHFLHPNGGGLLFLTLPKTCLQLSPYIDQTMFVQMLESVGLTVSSTRESPKIAFFICTKQSSYPPPVIIQHAKDHEDRDHASRHSNNGKWTKLSKIRRGKKYRNDFAIVLTGAP
jgi:25S rRNA (adenine(2142)-N(1))-methyltransferase, Bmt2